MQDERIDKCVQLKIAGWKIEAIATELKITKSSVHRLLNKDTAKLKMAKTRTEIAKVAGQVAESENRTLALSIEQKVKQYGEEGLDRMRDMLDSENEFVVVKAADSLMDRDSRLSKTKNTKIQGGVLHAFVTPEQLVAAARTAREIQTLGVVVPALPITAETMGIEEEESIAGSS